MVGFVLYQKKEGEDIDVLQTSVESVLSLSLEAALIKKWEGEVAPLSLVAAPIKKGEGEVASLSLVAALQRTRMIAGFLKMAADQGQEEVKRLLQRVLEAAVLKM